ncbi:MAG: 50S ribosomal protein L17 [Thermodesulfovibrio sp.]|nr:50S ribosomal protein L17 [Thermodesulfovibrio sp.]
MRHKVAGRYFGRTANQRKALFRGLIMSLFEHQRIETTLAKAKAIKRMAEKLVTFGKRGDLHSKRMVMSYIPNRAVTAKLFSDIAPRFVDRNGGYLRIVKTRQRVNDRAPMAIIEFVDYENIRAKTAGKESKKESKKETEKAGKEEVRAETKKTPEKPPEKTARKEKKQPKKVSKKEEGEKPKKAAEEKSKKETKKSATKETKKATQKGAKSE